MAPTRDRVVTTSSLDTGTGSPAALRPDVWTNAEPTGAFASDTGVGSPPMRRPDLLGEGDAFVPPPMAVGTSDEAWSGVGRHGLSI